MATIEHALIGLQTILETDYPVTLRVVQAEWNDGLKLEPLRAIEWTEMRNATAVTPCAMLLGIEDHDLEQRDMIREATILVLIVLKDQQKQALTQKLFRYADALRRVLRPATNRTLRGVLVSAKVTRVNYSPTFTNRDNLFARDFEATVALRVPRGEN